MKENKPKKILHLSRSMGQGGAEKVVLQLSQDKKYKYYVASKGGIFEKSLKQQGIKHILIPDMDKKNPFEMLKTLVILANVIKKEHIDIIHTHHRMAAFYARILKFRFKNLKHIYTAHNVFYNKKRMLKFALKNAFVVACGQTVKENLTNYFRIPNKQIKIIYNSIEKPEIFENNKYLENKTNEGSYLIGCIGRLAKQKGIDIFIQAIAIVIKQNPNVIGIIVGDGPDREKLENEVSNLGIKNNIVFLGFQKDVFSIMKQLKFVVLPSRWEGFPLTPIETFSVGKTIIVSDIPNNLEIVQDGINGLKFEVNNSDDLANKIQQLILNDALRFKLQNQAKKTYIERFSYKEFIRKYIAVYDELENQSQD